MTTLAPAPVPPPAAPTLPVPPRESAEARAARLGRRRRLVLWSSPVVAVVLLVALKILLTVAWGQQAGTAWTEGNVTSLRSAGERLGLLNVIEPWKAPFALGDADVLVSDWAGARGQFETALGLAPPGGLDSCQIRVNLARTLESLGDQAMASSGPSAATPFYDRERQVAQQAPAGCFQPDGQGTGQQLQQAQQRATDKSRQATQPQPQPAPSPPSQGQGAPTPEQQKQQQLDQKTKDNEQQRAEGDQGQRDSGSAGLPQVARPW